jgi:hypothetical protein
MQDLSQRDNHYVGFRLIAWVMELPPVIVIVVINVRNRMTSSHNVRSRENRAVGRLVKGPWIRQVCLGLCDAHSISAERQRARNPISGGERRSRG